MNVVEQWRSRAQRLRAQMWRCASCASISPVRRHRCAACGSDQTPRLEPLAGGLAVLAWSHDHLTLERSDGLAGPALSVLVRTPGNCLTPLMLSEADYAFAPQLVGHEVDPVVRRMSPPLSAESPISYGIKAAATRATRSLLLHPPISED